MVENRVARKILPQADDLPPDPSDSEPDDEINDGDDKSVAPPIRERDITSTVEDGRRPYPVMSESPHEVRHERKHARPEVRGRTHRARYWQERREHCANVCRPARKEIVGVEV